MKLRDFPKRAGQFFIIAYQRTLSPDHGWMKRVIGHPVCRYTPTCSEFGYQALERYGLLKGSWMTCKRVLRCTPWHIGGHDPVP